MAESKPGWQLQSKSQDQHSMKAGRSLTLSLLVGALLIVSPITIRGEEFEEQEEDDVDETDVIVLTTKNFEKVTEKAKYALVEFYAPWCGHCKSLKPEYAKAATTLKNYDSSIVVAKVDATIEEDLAKRFDVSGFPTMKWFVDGKESDYDGGRQAQDIVQWVKRKTGPPTTEVTSVAALTKVQKDDTFLVLGYFNKFSGNDHKIYEAIAVQSEHSQANFYKTTDEAVAEKLGIKEAPGFAVSRQYEPFGIEVISTEGHQTFEGAGSLKKKLSNFLQLEKLPAFMVYSPENAGPIFNSGINYQVVVIAPGESFKAGQHLYDLLVEASLKLKGKLVIVAADLHAADSATVVDFFGFNTTAEEPQIAGFDAEAGVKYSFQDMITASKLITFGKDVISGKAKRLLKSAPDPTEPKEGGVTIVTGNTFDKIVLDPKKDVLLEVYAPWCGYCQEIEPKYKELAMAFEKIQSVVIAKMDGTENEHPDAIAQGYPTILFFPAKRDAAPIEYERSKMTLASFAKFIEENAAIKFEMPSSIPEEEEEEEEEDEEDGEDWEDEEDEDNEHDEL